MKLTMSYRIFSLIMKLKNQKLYKWIYKHPTLSTAFLALSAIVILYIYVNFMFKYVIWSENYVLLNNRVELWDSGIYYRKLYSGWLFRGTSSYHLNPFQMYFTVIIQPNISTGKAEQILKQLMENFMPILFCYSMKIHIL